MNLRDAGSSSKVKKTNTYIFKKVGIFAGILAFLSLFMVQIKISNKGLDLLLEKHKANAYYDAYKFAAGYVMLNLASLLAYVAAIKCDVMKKS